MKPIIWFFYMMNETFNGTYFQKKKKSIWAEYTISQIN